MARKMKRVDFYNEPVKKKDTKEERRKYLIAGYIVLILIAIVTYLVITFL